MRFGYEIWCDDSCIREMDCFWDSYREAYHAGHLELEEMIEEWRSLGCWDDGDIDAYSVVVTEEEEDF